MITEGLGAIWKILAETTDDADPSDVRTRLEGVIYGIKEITRDVWLSTSRKMVTVLGWRRRRDYEELFDALEQLGKFRDVDNFEINYAIFAVWEVNRYLELLRPDTEQYFKGLWRRTPKASSLGYTVQMYAGVIDRYGNTVSPAATR